MEMWYKWLWGQNPGILINTKTFGKWMFIPNNMVFIRIFTLIYTLQVATLMGQTKCFGKMGSAANPWLAMMYWFNIVIFHSKVLNSQRVSGCIWYLVRKSQMNKKMSGFIKWGAAWLRGVTELG